MDQQTETMPQAQQEQSGGGLAVQQSRAIAEVQAQMAIAKRFPRDTNAAFSRIIRACQRRGLAEQAQYAYPRGNTTVTGPSVRLAEALAQNWGNLDFGIVELEQRQGESVVMAYCTDIETNVRQQKTFVVKHIRDTKQGPKKLTDGRDIYELTANQGARRLRACILGVIPGDIVEAAEKECEKTLAGKSAEPLQDRARKMLVAFTELGVTKEMIEKRLAHNLEALIEAELIQLQKIFRSIKDGMTGRSDWFEFESSKQQDQPSLSEKVAKSKAANVPSSPAAQTTPSVTEQAKQPSGVPGATATDAARAAPVPQQPQEKPLSQIRDELIAAVALEMSRLGLTAETLEPEIQDLFKKTGADLSLVEMQALHKVLSGRKSKK